MEVTEMKLPALREPAVLETKEVCESKLNQCFPENQTLSLENTPKFSLFKNIGDGQPQAISEEDLINHTRSGDWCYQSGKKINFEKGRSLNGESLSNFKKNLPPITPSVICEGGHAMEHVKGLTDFVHYDVDKVPESERQTVREAINDNPYTRIAFESPSGSGFKVFVNRPSAMTLENFSSLYIPLAEKVAQGYFKYIDGQCSNSNRLCFVSYDPEIYVNREALTADLTAHGTEDSTTANEAVYKDLSYLNGEFGEEAVIDAIIDLSKLINETDPLRPPEQRPEPFLGERVWNHSVHYLAGSMATRGHGQKLVLDLMWRNRLINYDGTGEKDFKKSVSSAYKFHDKASEVLTEKKKKALDLFIRVGDVYYKHAGYFDQYGQRHTRLEKTGRQTLIDDYGKDFLKKIPKYDNFCNVPSNTDYRPVHGKSYNLYSPMEHTPMQGSWSTIEVLLRHVYDEQYEIGLDYLQLLYQKPTQLLPVFCLVSKQNETAKTTCGKFLNMIFGANACMIGCTELVTEFNGSFASKLCIVVDESEIDIKYMPKIKMLATADKIQLRKMHQDHSEIGFFGKFILLSNNETNFISASGEDLRYWVRKVPKIKSFDPGFTDKLKAEIPAFLFFLQSRVLSTPHESRMYFSPEVLKTDALEAIREGSKSRLRQEIEYAAINRMEEKGIESINYTPDDIHQSLLYCDRRWTRTEIIGVLKNEMGLDSCPESKRYKNMDGTSKTGRFYTLRLKQLKPILGYEDLL